MIHLEHTPASVVLEMVDRVPLTAGDVFVDIGSGLGQVAMLVHLLTGVTAEGIEVEPAYVALARDRAQELGLEQVRFVCADARQADLTAGTVFFLFAPCFGTMLDEVIARLRQRAQAGPITVCSYGPSSPVLARAPWLRFTGRGAGDPFGLTILRSHA
jgi:SAM-dependent methyltransferase